MKYLPLLLAGFLVSCSTEEAPSNVTENLDGQALMKHHCYSCHNTQGTSNMLAPPMSRVKDHYYSEGVSRKTFIEAIVKWVENPNEETSVMPGALRKFGLMPKQNFDKQDVEAIAAYLYDSNLEQEGCNH